MIGYNYGVRFTDYVSPSDFDKVVSKFIMEEIANEVRVHESVRVRLTYNFWSGQSTIPGRIDLVIGGRHTYTIATFSSAYDAKKTYEDFVKEYCYNKATETTEIPYGSKRQFMAKYKI